MRVLLLVALISILTPAEGAVVSVAAGLGPKKRRAEVAAPALPILNLYSSTVTVSGFDSGAIFATQLQISFSSTFKAFGLISSAPYLCGQGNLAASTYCMDTPELLDIDFFVSQTQGFAAEQKVDDLHHLSDHYVLLFSSPSDLVVNHDASVQLQSMYHKLDPSSSTTTTATSGACGIHVATMYNDSQAQHAWITSEYGNSCGHLGPDYVNNCGIDFAGHFLSSAFDYKEWNHLLPGNGSQPLTRGTYNASHMLKWDQVAFGANATLDSLAATGYIYIPLQCQPTSSSGGGGKKCHLHVHFHGCDQAADIVGGTAYVKRTGINEWAETMDLVVLYPQVAMNVLKFNPSACWDWFGYNNLGKGNYLEYATKGGVQIQMMYQVVQSLLLGL